jgi:small conductance mechanosensitive channel
MHQTILIHILFSFLSSGLLTTPDEQELIPVQATAPTKAQPQDKATPSQITDADRISRLQRVLEANKQRLDELQQQLDKPSKDYVETEESFKKLDAALQKKKNELKKLPDDKAADSDKLQQAIDQLEKDIKPLRDRFNQNLQDRKLRLEKINNLQQLIKLDQETLQGLLGNTPAPGKTPAPATTAPANAKQAPSGNNGTTPPAAVSKETPLPSLLPGVTPVMPGLPAVVSTQPVPSTTPPVAPSPELLEAQAQAKAKQVAAEKAKNEAETVTERIEILRKNIQVERALLDSAKRKVDLEQKQHDDMILEQDKQLQQQPSPDLWQKIWKLRSESATRMGVARKEMRDTADRLETLLQQISHVQAEELRARNEALNKQHEATAAVQKVVQLQNPFTLQNMQNWLLHHGIRIVVIIVSMYLLRKFILLFSKQIVDFISHHHHRGTEKDRGNRAETLVGVFRNTVSMLIIVGGLLMIGDEIGVPIAPLLGGAAMIGLAVAFGAQNLIRDYFTGFMVLMEDQYGINDVVKIGSISGMVEKITLRMTVLRDLEGVVHFIPHGTISTVSNLTHGWSRALLDIKVPLSEDPDRMMDMFRDMVIDMRKDAHFGQLIIEDPEMLGVEAVNNDGITIRFLIKTVPLQQWTVKRELLRRIKQRFDLLKIQFPIPQHLIQVQHSAVNPSGPNATTLSS